MKNIILEEIDRAKLLMNYNTKNTLNENLKSSDVFNFNKKLINEQGAKAILTALFGASDEAALKALKTTKSAKYLNAVKFLDDPVILANTGFKNVDDLISAMAKGTLKPVQLSGVAKGLLKKGTITGNFRTTLTNKAADLGVKKLGYGSMTGKQIKTDLITKGYNPAIADEIALRAVSKNSKIPVVPKDIDDAIANLSKVPQKIKKSRWSSWKTWAIAGSISVGVAALLYSMFNDDSPIELEDTDVTPSPSPAPIPKTPRYRNCDDELKYTKGCKTTPEGDIGQVQSCLGIVQDGKFWDRTQEALKAAGFSDGFTKQDISKICGNTTPPTPQPDVEDEYEDADAGEADNIITNT